MQKQTFPFFLAGILVVIMACNRKMTSDGAAGAAALVGTWELREVQAGMMPNQQHPEGNGDQYAFTESRYEHYVNGALEKSGAYRVERDTTAQKEVGLQLPPGEFGHRIVFEDDPSTPRTFFQISGDKLVLLSGYFPTDGGSRFTYQKLAERK